MNVHARRGQLLCIIDGHGSVKIFTVEAALYIAQLLTVAFVAPAHSRVLCCCNTVHLQYGMHINDHCT